MIVKIPTKMSVSSFVGFLKDKNILDHTAFDDENFIIYNKYNLLKFGVVKFLKNILTRQNLMI